MSADDGKRAVFADHFSSRSADYARYRPHYPKTLFSWLSGLAPAHGLAWDCATGSGQAALSLTAHFSQVIATDASAEQLARAVQHPAIDYREASAEQSGLADASIDLLTVAQALHWFDTRAFFNEAQRVLKPGGVIAAWTYQLLTIDAGIDALIGHLYREIVGHYWPPQRALVEAGYDAIDLPFARVPAPAFAMQEDWQLGHLVGYLGTWSAVKRYREETGDDPLQRIIGDLQQAWGEPQQSKPVSWPLGLLVGRKAVA